MNQTEQHQETELGELPKDWKVIHITEVLDFERGAEPGSDNYNDKGKGIRFLRVSDITGNRTEYIYTESEKIKTCSDNDILISFDGSPGIVKKGFTGAYSSGIRKVNINDKNADAEYIFYILQSRYVQNIIQKYATGVTIKHASKSIPHIIIPYPSMPEQKKIAYVLSTVQNAQQSSERVINSLKELKKSLMKHLFTYGAVSFEEKDNVQLKVTDIGSIPAEWNLIKIGDIAKVIRGASPRPKGDPKYYGGDVPRLMVSDVTRDYKYVTPKIDFLTKEGSKKSRWMKKGDIIIQVSGNPGTPCILNVDCCIHDGFAGLLNLNRDTIDSEFLFYYLSLIKDKSSSLAFGSIFKNLQTYAIAKFDIPLPSMTEQTKISSILASVDTIIEDEQNKLASMNKLFNSMLKDLTTAKARVNDLNTKAINLVSMNKNEVVDVINTILPEDQSIDHSRADFVMSLMGQLNGQINNTTKEEVEETIKKTKEWLKIAEDDLDSSKLLLQQKKYRRSMQDLQQAVEKLVKAFCIAFHILPDKEVRDVSHKTPMAFIKMVKREWVTPYVEVLKQRHPELNTDTTKLEETIYKKDDELANINEKTLGVMLDTLDKIEIALESKNDEVKGFIKKVTDEFGVFMEEKQRKNVEFALGKFDMRIACAFMNLYIISAVTYPHFMSRYPDDKMSSLTSYDDNLAVIKHADRIFKIMDKSIYQLKNYLEIQNGKDWN